MPRVEAMLPAVPHGRLQPCLRDVWHDHLLFEGERLAGLIDYAAAGVDTVATDLARLLGSLVEDDEGGWQAGLKAYREVAPLGREEERLARLLDRTGVAVGVFHWVRRLSGRAPVEDMAAALGRLEALVRRLEG
jgi:Ser/Thr protein kinase RdoA (MazF antagonist)